MTRTGEYWASQSADADVDEQNRRHVDRRPLVPQDRLAAAVDEPVRRHEVRHVDRGPDPRLRAGADEHEIRPPAEQQRHEDDQRQPADEEKSITGERSSPAWRSSVE